MSIFLPAGEVRAVVGWLSGDAWHGSVFLVWLTPTPHFSLPYTVSGVPRSGESQVNFLQNTVSHPWRGEGESAVVCVWGWGDLLAERGRKGHMETQPAPIQTLVGSPVSGPRLTTVFLGVWCLKSWKLCGFWRRTGPIFYSFYPFTPSRAAYC